MFQDTDCSDWDYELTDMDLDTNNIDLDTHDMSDTQENVLGDDTQVTAGPNMAGALSNPVTMFTPQMAAKSLELDFNDPHFTFETGVDNTFVFTLGEETSNRALERICERNLGQYPSVWTLSLPEPVPYTADEASEPRGS
ncbi:hypothetical protein DFH06DRAFT_1152130 [Mycena polygramma]|nr:hypothetical protein DFH06DRAFT_1152130 [Mycena polygramma]